MDTGQRRAIRTGTPAPHVLLATLDRPEVRNAFGTALAVELRDLWAGLYLDPGEVRCVVLTGAGSAFCAGGDLKERRAMDDAAWRRQHRVFEQAFMAMIDCPVPVIAAVNGPAFAGGLELVAASDFAYAVQDARFAMTEVSLGIMPGAMGTQTLPRAVGPRRAKELILGATPFSAEEALAWGLVNRLFDDVDQLMAAALEMAQRIAGHAPLSVRQAKKALDAAAATDPRTGYRFELEAYEQTVVSDDRREGMAAFHEKRRPVFKGR